MPVFSIISQSAWGCHAEGLEAWSVKAITTMLKEREIK